jgi:hypothetical protein
MKKQEQGYVLISVILAVSLVLLTLLVASTYTQLTSRVLTLQLNYQGQALNTAQAGLSEGADWFRRQAVQPVVTFNPQRNMAANPPINDTDVQTVPPSIQRDYQISAPGNVWGHYEVWTGNAANGTGVLDLSQNRRGSGSAAGAIWQLESTGVVYVQNNPNVAYNVSPNQILATKVVRSEIQKIAVHLPDNAALSINAGGASVSLGSTDPEARVVGGLSARGVSSTNAVSPSVAAGATLSGNPGYAQTAGSFLMTNVFSVTSQSDLAGIADINVSSVAQLPNPLPSMQMIIINGNATFDSTTRPLVGSGILIVNGNLTINSSPSPSSFNGVIYVTGTFSDTGPCTINGSVVVNGSSATVDGAGGGNFGEIYFDPFMISQVQQQLSQYRFSRSGYVPCPSWDTNCNSRFAGGS